MSGTKGHSGGARENSGPPKGTKYGKRSKTVSEKTKAGILKAANRLKKKYGIPLEEAMLELCYDKSTQASVKASVWKSYLEALVAKETDQKVDLTSQGPAIFLPTQDPDPGLDVPESGS